MQETRRANPKNEYPKANHRFTFLLRAQGDYNRALKSNVGQRQSIPTAPKAVKKRGLIFGGLTDTFMGVSGYAMTTQQTDNGEAENRPE